MHSRPLLAVTMLSVVAAGLLPAAETATAPSSPKRPNVLFIAVDDLRPELGCYGNALVRTPNIDRLARAGLVFERAYVQQAVCSPSRSSVMTGTRPDTTKVWDLVTHFRTALPDVVTLGQHFKAHGYHSQGMGKIYHGGYDDARTWSVPWDTPKAPMYALPENLALHQRQFKLPPVAPDTDSGGGTTKFDTRGPAFEGADVPDNFFTDGKTAELAVDTLRQLAAERKPFFLAVGFAKPHLPFVAPKRYWDLYDPAKIELAPNPYRPKNAPEYSILSGNEMRAYHGIPTGSVPPDLARQLKHGYLAATSYTDANVGRLLDELERSGLRENTIVVLWGDHGWKLGEHDAWCKHSNSENDTNAPLIISAPGIRAPGLRTRALVEFVDIYPTLCELAGLPQPAHLEGVSAAPLFQDPNRAWKRAAFSQYPRSVKREGAKNLQLMGYSMRTDRYRLTVWTHRKEPETIEAVELYDLATDPMENENLANDPARTELVQKLLEQWRGGWKAERERLSPY